MCGIIGHIGKNMSSEILLQGLKNLEYRGYDSAGVALFGNDIKIIKSVGKIMNLEEKLKLENLDDYHIGIGHTRWATNGKVNLENAHPHRYGKVTLVHNGIIENASYLKEQLISEGYKFSSDTDSEVIAVLIDKYLEDDVIKTFNKVMSLLDGSYALGIIIAGIDKLFVIKNKSPLVIGVGDDYYFASDISAINEYTNNFIIMDDLEIAELSNELKIYKKDKEIKKKIETIVYNSENKGKNGYSHYMLKEIHDEPALLEKVLNPYINDLSKLPDLVEYEEIHIIGCGSALYAGMIGKTLFEENSNTKVMCEVASEYRYKNNIYNNRTLIILISQSGETADTIAVLELAKEKNIDTLAIINNPQSTIARNADKAIYIEAGEEIAVATTKAYILQVGILSLLSLKLAYSKKLITNIDRYLDEFRNVSKYVKNIIDNEEVYKNIADKIFKKNNLFFIGRGIDYTISLEGSLKLKEVSYIHSEAYQAGELKHGTISLIDENIPVIGIITDNKLASKTMSNILEVKSRGAEVYIITKKELKTNLENEILVENNSSFTISLLVVPVLQLIAYYTALKRGCDIDKPKNLAKSVTVE